MIKSGDTLYLVSTGKYSDYSVAGVFSSRQLAEEYMGLSTGPWNDIEELTLDPAVLQRRAGLIAFTVTLLRDGTVEDCRSHDALPDRTEHRLINRRIDLREPGPEKGRQVLWVSCWARDKAHAIKIAGEIRSQVIANNEWKPEAA